MNSKKVYIKNNRRTILIYILSILLALMWAAAAFGKLTDLDTFHNELVKSPLLEGFANTVKWVVPCGELLLAIALIYRATQLFAFYTSVFLLSLFIAYIVVIIRFSYYDIPCACSGFAEGLSWEGHLIFNASCMILAIVAIFISQENQQGSNTGLRRYCTIGQKPARKKWCYTFFSYRL